MDPTIDDYQTVALFGGAPNYSALDATMLNPAAQGPGDWTTILTSGIAGAAVNGINASVNNAIIAGQIANNNATTSMMVKTTGGRHAHGIPPLLIAFAVLYFVVQ